MHEYTAFGARLSSALSFPELEPWHPPGAGGPGWRLDVEEFPPPGMDGGLLLGEADYAGGAHMTLHRSGDTWQLGTSDAGSWRLNPAAGRMWWYRTSDAREAVARYDAIGRVMPLMLHATGHLSLHAAGVAVDGGGTVIVGPKGRGKSSLALACVAAGARLAGDDVSIIRPGVQPMLHPGAPFVRLRADSARALERAVPHENAAGGSKVLVPPSAIGRRLLQPVPLRSIHLLEMSDATGAPVRRVRLPGPQAALALVAQATNARLLGRDGERELLDRVSSLVSTVRVYAFYVARDLALVSHAARQLVKWVREDSSRAPAVPSPVGTEA